MGEREKLNKLTEGFTGAAIEVHCHLGPGLLESAYQAALAYELSQRGYEVEQQKPLPMLYKEIKLDAGYRLNALVNDKVVLESNHPIRLSHSPCTNSVGSEAIWL